MTTSPHLRFRLHRASHFDFLPALGAGASILLLASLASAQTSAPNSPAASTGVAVTAPSPEFDDRTLAGHTFIYPILQDGAFNTTHFGIRQGFALETIPQFPLSSLGTFSLSATGLVQDFDLAVKILPWIGVYGKAEGTVATGANIDSLLLFGGQFAFDGEGGVVGRIARIESTGTQIAVRLYGGGGTGRNLGVLPLVSELVSNTKSTLGSVVQGNIGKYVLVPVSNDEFGGSVHAAQAAGRFVGIQAALQGQSMRQTTSPYNGTENVAATVSTTSLQASVSVDVDASPAGVPLGAMAEYQFQFNDASASSVSTSGTANLLGLGIYYTGRHNLLLGVAGKTELNQPPLQGVSKTGSAEQSGTPSLYYGQFVLRYIW
jgi:hypothetical protein